MSRVPRGPSTDKDKDGVCFQHSTSLSSAARACLAGGGGGGNPLGQHGTEGRGSRKDAGPQAQDVAADARLGQGSAHRLGPAARSARPQREAHEDHHGEETSFPSESPNLTHSSC